MYLFVCLSVSAHALIGCLEVGLFLYVYGAREGGQRISATAKQPRAVKTTTKRLITVLGLA